MKREEFLEVLASDASLSHMPETAKYLRDAARAIRILRDRIDELGGYHDDI